MKLNMEDKEMGNKQMIEIVGRQGEKDLLMLFEDARVAVVCIAIIPVQTNVCRIGMKQSIGPYIIGMSMVF